MNNEQRFGSFHEATGKTFRYLRDRVDLDAWLIVRAHEAHWVVVDADDRIFGFKQGDSIRWDAPRIQERRNQPRHDLAHLADGRVRFPGRASTNVHELGTLAAFPMKSADGAVLGFLCGIHTRSSSALGEETNQLLEMIAGLLGHLLENEIDMNSLTRTNKRLGYEAMTDALTNLPNRRAWEEKLLDEQHRLSDLGEPTFVSVVDLDALKQINDRHGHNAGDRLLRETAHVLLRAVRDTDFVARVGGDEFAVLGIQPGSIDAEWVSTRFRSALKAAGISASVGTVLAEPGSSLGPAWADADMFMYENKRLRAKRAQLINS